MAQEVRSAAEEHTDAGTRTDTDTHGRTRTGNGAPETVLVSPCQSVSPADLPKVLAANGALSLLNLCLYLLEQQLQSQADSFEKDGGFTERLYRRRINRRDHTNTP